ncbi:MAG: transposon-encoded TnpW family protein [Roseburia inulinivorans]
MITTQRNGQTIVAELFFNPNGTETFSDKLLKTILADSLRFSASDGQELEKQKSCDNSRPTIHSWLGRFLSSKTPFSPSQELRKTPEKCPIA